MDPSQEPIVLPSASSFDCVGKEMVVFLCFRDPPPKSHIHKDTHTHQMHVTAFSHENTLLHTETQAFWAIRHWLILFASHHGWKSNAILSIVRTLHHQVFLDLSVLDITLHQGPFHSSACRHWRQFPETVNQTPCNHDMTMFHGLRWLASLLIAETHFIVFFS